MVFRDPHKREPCADRGHFGCRGRDSKRIWRHQRFGLDEGQVAVYGQTAETRQYTFEDRVGTDRIRGHGIPEALEAILFRKSQMLAKVALSLLVIPFVITGLVALGRNLDAKEARA